MRQSPSKRRITWALALAPLLVSGVWLAIHSRPPAPADPQPSSARGSRSATRLRAPEPRLAAPAPHAPAAHARTAPFIERVSIDQSVACRDEPLTVEVVAHGGDHDDASLVTVVDGHPGNPAVTSFASSGDWVVRVLVYDQARPNEIARRELNVKIRDCDARDRLELEVVQHPGSRMHEFVARLPDSQAADDKGQRALQTASLAWDFGDGTARRAPFSTTHQYDDAALPKSMRTFVVTAEAHVGGRVLRGKRSLTLHSEYLANKERGVITPEVRVGETRALENGYAAALEVTQFEQVSLHLESADVTLVPCGSGSSAEPSAVKGPAERYLSTTELQPGRSTLELRVAASELPPRTCLAQLSFNGRSPAGEAVYMTTHLRLALPRSDAPRETDVAELRTLTRALSLLGREPRDGAVVTDDELASLRARGEL